MPMAPPPARARHRDWAHHWHKFLVERVGIEPLQLGLLLLLFLSLATLLFLLISISLRFCCCPSSKRRRTDAVVSRTSSSATKFSSTNEERRRLLQPNGIGEGRSSEEPTEQKIRSEKTENEEQNGGGEDDQNKAEGEGTMAGERGPDERNLPPEGHRQRTAEEVPERCREVPDTSCTPPVSRNFRHRFGPTIRSAHLPPAEESPPPPRRFVSGGRTQVLPLTGHAARRLPPLALLAADQPPKGIDQRRVATGTPESRAATTKSCETIPEEGEEPTGSTMADELLSIDRTFVSFGDSATLPPHFPSSSAAFYRVNRSALRASPFPHPCPKFEIAPPAYSPPSPPTTHRYGSSDCCGPSNDLSSPGRSSCGCQTPLNTTTGSCSTSEDIGIGLINITAGIRISELESETGEEPERSRRAAGERGEGQEGPSPRRRGPRVPRSISQQLDLMNMNTSS